MSAKVSALRKKEEVPGNVARETSNVTTFVPSTKRNAKIRKCLHVFAKRFFHCSPFVVQANDDEAAEVGRQTQSANANNGELWFEENLQHAETEIKVSSQRNFSII